MLKTNIYLLNSHTPIEFYSSGGGMLFLKEKEINLILELSKAFMEDKDEN